MSSADQFFKFPAWLLASTLSDRAMILYMLIADRVQASAKNGFTDDKAHIAIIQSEKSKKSYQ